MDRELPFGPAPKVVQQRVVADGPLGAGGIIVRVEVGVGAALRSNKRAMPIRPQRVILKSWSVWP